MTSNQVWQPNQLASADVEMANDQAQVNDEPTSPLDVGASKAAYSRTLYDYTLAQLVAARKARGNIAGGVTSERTG